MDYGLCGRFMDYIYLDYILARSRRLQNAVKDGAEPGKCA